MKMSDAFPSKWLTAAELEDEDGNPADQTLTIREAVMEEMEIPGKDPVEKPVVYFEEIDKGLVLNKTNGKSIAGMYGNDTEDWAGERVTLYPTEVNFQGTMTPCIRVRGKVPKKAKAPTLKDSPAVLTPANPGPMARTPATAILNSRMDGEDIGVPADEDLPF